MDFSSLHFVVTGSSGLCGRRLVDMLVEKYGARLVTAFDVVAPSPPFHHGSDRVRVVVGDLADRDAVARACEGADAVFHLGALVGPFYEEAQYERVNVELVFFFLFMIPWLFGLFSFQKKLFLVFLFFSFSFSFFFLFFSWKVSVCPLCSFLSFFLVCHSFIHSFFLSLSLFVLWLTGGPWQCWRHVRCIEYEGSFTARLRPRA